MYFVLTLTREAIWSGETELNHELYVWNQFGSIYLLLGLLYVTWV